METRQYPEWVPRAVVQAAVGLQIRNEQLERFLSHPAMKTVWSTLLDRQVSESAIKAADEGFGLIASLEIASIFGFSTNEVACALLYWRVVQTTMRVYNGKHVAPTRKELNQATRPYDDAVSRLLWIKSNVPFWREHESAKLCEAADALIAYCKDISGLIRQEGSPFVLTRSSKARGESDVVRSYTRGIAVTTKALWGAYLYGTLATIAEVLFDLPEREDRAASVEDWCRDLPSQ